MKVIISLILLATLTYSGVYFNYPLFNVFASLLIILDFDLYYLTQNKLIIYKNRLHSLIIYFVYPLILLHMYVCHIYHDVIDVKCLTPILLELIIAFLITKIIVKKDQIKIRKQNINIESKILLFLIIIQILYIVLNHLNPFILSLKIVIILYLISTLIFKNRITKKHKLSLNIITIILSMITLEFITPTLLILLNKKNK